MSVSSGDKVNLIIINGAMGVGKSATAECLTRQLESNVYLDGDWCWKAKPFVVNDNTKAMVLKNIAFVLNGFISSGEYKNVIFTWVMQEQGIIDSVLSALRLSGVNTFLFTLVCDEKTLIERVERDIASGVRAKGDELKSAEYLKKYVGMRTVSIDNGKLTPFETAAQILKKINCGHNA